MRSSSLSFSQRLLKAIDAQDVDAFVADLSRVPCDATDPDVLEAFPDVLVRLFQDGSDPMVHALLAWCTHDDLLNGGLHAAVSSGRAVLLETLMQRKINVNVVAFNGATLLHTAVHHQHAETANILRCLVERGVPLNACNHHGETALARAVLDENDKTVGILLGLGADPNVLAGVRTNGKTLLEVVVHLDNLSILTTLLNHGASVRTSASYASVLHMAAQYGRYAMVERLLEAGADTETEDNRGHTPLLLALKKEYWDVAQRLIDAGANPFHTDHQGVSPWSFVQHHPVIFGDGVPIPKARLMASMENRSSERAFLQAVDASTDITVSPSPDRPAPAPRL